MRPKTRKVPKLEKQHYEWLAAFLASQFPLDESWRTASSYWHFLTLRLADELTESNPRFDRERFLEACGWAKR